MDLYEAKAIISELCGIREQLKLLASHAKLLLDNPNKINVPVLGKREESIEGKQQNEEGALAPIPLVSETLPNAGQDVKPKKRRTDYAETFEVFWKDYPPRGNPACRNGKGLAYKRWKRLSDKKRELAISGLTDQLSWGVFDRDARFIPMASTWLNREGWLDEKPVGPKGAGLSDQDFESEDDQKKAWGGGWDK